MTGKQLVIWKHDCVKHGQGLITKHQPIVSLQLDRIWGIRPILAVAQCDPPCDDPWQVDAPYPTPGGTFPTHAEAIRYADSLVVALREVP